MGTKVLLQKPRRVDVKIWLSSKFRKYLEYYPILVLLQKNYDGYFCPFGVFVVIEQKVATIIL